MKIGPEAPVGDSNTGRRFRNPDRGEARGMENAVYNFISPGAKEVECTNWRVYHVQI